MHDILATLGGKWGDGTRPKDLYTEYVSNDAGGYLPVIIGGLSHSDKRAQNGCAEIASLISIDYPELIYPHIDLFIEKLDSKAPVQRWEAVHIIGNLAKVDKDKRTPSLIPKIHPLLENKSIVIAGYAVQTLSKIGEAYPEHAEETLDMLIEKSPFFTGNRVGFIIESTVRLLGYEALHPKIRGFVEPYTESEIGVVKRKARKLIKQMNQLDST